VSRRIFSSVFLLIASFAIINNLLQQILSLHILHFITAHFTFITAQIGYHCTLKLGMLLVRVYMYSVHIKFVHLFLTRRNLVGGTGS
jgi:hypothetical protein